MTMMIMRFNRLIQSRVLWIGFTIIIVISFVFWGAFDGSGSDRPRAGQPYATFMGEEISYDEQSFTKRLVQEFNRERIDPEELDEQVDLRLAALAHARVLGLDVPLQFAESQFMQQFVGEDGQIDEQLMQQQLAQMQSMGIRPGNYIAYMRQELTLNQYQRSLASSSLVPRSKLDEIAQRVTDEFELLYAEIPAAPVRDALQVTQEQLESFYADNTNRFALGEARSARVLVVPVQTVTDTNAVTDTEVEAFYTANPERYVREIAPNLVMTNETAGTELIPLEEVASDIRAELIRQQSLDNTLELTQTFAVSMVRRYGRAFQSIDDIVKDPQNAAYHLSIRETGFVRQGDELAGFERGNEIISSIFETGMDPLERVGEAIQGDNEFYVPVLTEIKAGYVPALSEVLEDVQSAATNHYFDLTIDTLGSNYVEQLQAKVNGGESFSNAVASLSLTATNTPPFQIRELNNRFAAGWPTSLAQFAAEGNAGEVIGPAREFTGERYVGYIVKRSEQIEALAEIQDDARNYLAGLFQQGAIPNHYEEFLKSNFELTYKGEDEEEADADSE